jgi:hypothetical protein
MNSRKHSRLRLIQWRRKFAKHWVRVLRAEQQSK